MPKREPSGEKTPPGLSRLPPGRHGLSREFVTKNQRDRITAGMIATVAEHGYNAATISQIAEAAGVSRKTFYKYYSGKEECFRATYQLIADHLEAAGRAAADGEGEWPDKVRARIVAVLDAFAANPDLVTFTMIAPRVAGGEPADFYRSELGRALALLTEDLPVAASRPSAAAEESLIGAVSGLVVREVRAGRGGELPALLPDLLELVLAPYLGREEAAKAALR
ncbi:MAG TPA: TetR/AcrR family transcriptional regulator [Solirubrobacterales bacterium]